MPALSSEARAIALLALAAFVSASAFRICDPMLPQLAAEFGTTTGQAARAVTAFAVAYGVSRLDRTARAKAERAAFADQFVRGQTGLGASGAVDH